MFFRVCPLPGLLIPFFESCVTVWPLWGLVVVGFVGVGRWLVGVWGLLVENYTVDASIFVVKLLRADGGCLGTRSR